MNAKRLKLRAVLISHLVVAWAIALAGLVVVALVWMLVRINAWLLGLNSRLLTKYDYHNVWYQETIDKINRLGDLSDRRE